MRTERLKTSKMSQREIQMEWRWMKREDEKEFVCEREVEKKWMTWMMMTWMSMAVVLWEVEKEKKKEVNWEREEIEILHQTHEEKVNVVNDLL